MSRYGLLAASAVLSLMSCGAQAQQAAVSADWVRAHETFLASDELRGRGSATPDEAVAAAYVASQFLGFGLKTAPGMDGYIQKAPIVRLRLDGAPGFTADGQPVAGATLLVGRAEGASGKLAIFTGKKLDKLPTAEVLLVTTDLPPMQIYRAAAEHGAKLVIVRASKAASDFQHALGDQPRMPVYLKGETPKSRASLVVLPADAFDALAKKPGTDIALSVKVKEEISVTTNAVGWLPGSDPKAGVLLISAHLDHLGVRPDGVIMHGANDDASGTTAVLELARTLATAKQAKRGILFVAYGSEEAGGFGSHWFAEHPPVPLDQIVANLEIEMIGAQDPKLPAGTMMMTGFERSTMGETLKAHGALVTSDPYPDEHFFQRSDNYGLALKGVVAHTVSGWAVVPTYHSPEDTLANLDIPFMTRAIQSLVEPIHSLADSDAKPEWKPGGKPTE